MFEISRISIVKNSCLTNSACFHCANICRKKFIICLQAVNIFLNQRQKFWSQCGNDSQPNDFLSGEKNFKPPSFLSKSLVSETNMILKRMSEITLNTAPKLIYLNRKRLSFFILNGENILSSARKTTFYPRDKNHEELTKRQMKTMNKQIYSKLISHNNIELSDKFNITKKSSLISIFLSVSS